MAKLAKEQPQAIQSKGGKADPRSDLVRTRSSAPLPTLAADCFCCNRDSQRRYKRFFTASQEVPR